ncbi:tRNA (adenosine(37)-N6)-threonylcarbamoyltransferase complex dimerization subunit type 1 TsaB [Arthrobacter sp. MYb229]|uniref:tRNA (adenosine(37)-N6)-threonylcarbamoyltransferase complex dimerization subunit type 1 TsaB n=1 Tax=Micrococcaceae TaxID=1268 RepID=UPI000BB81FAC|nr:MULTISPECIES: tRNA (adenosine(37)-N6)-threonylcarbamoyltransferase complex dimerization subunit type 1 TsaB [Micrococcaceae]PCC29882.1 tRNA (adenosine(37)-N6)-threonylcarbamoyltransferase complex dimerization subunit type 1 TsaB [Glutamicibacter sp. BW80]PRA06124.1 tRNA (adenosine(37)-N6)-threonylcarbamoyltransferase complex dimerization subunit type 1 TsaB [Arthrobacter sp. MYb229]PRB53026.1 tRNA (adenosine(37)-N6)-threonylcarbamoyltransferase complex dimerization subunit type 1 TsaB [Arthro
MPNYLSIDTSAHASVALVDYTTGSVIAQRTSPKGNDQTETLASYVRDMLEENNEEGKNLAGIFVGVGPGPFTGLRVGLVAARTFGFVWNVPVHGIMSLHALAERVLRSGENPKEFVVASDARRKELYWARYDAEGKLLDGPHVSAATELPVLPVYGVGAGLYKEQLESVGSQPRERSFDWVIDARHLAHRGMDDLASGLDLSDTAPQYLRESDAQVPAFMKKAKA